MLTPADTGAGVKIAPGLPELMLASNPALFTVSSDVKASSAVLDGTVTLAAAAPLKDCTRFAPTGLLPLYTFTKSYPDSVLKLEKVMLIDVPEPCSTH